MQVIYKINGYVLELIHFIICLIVYVIDSTNVAKSGWRSIGGKLYINVF